MNIEWDVYEIQLKFCEDRWFCHLVVCQNYNFAHESHVVLLIVCLFFPQCWQIFEEWFSMDSRWRSVTQCRFWRNVKVVNVVVVLLTINFFFYGCFFNYGHFNVLGYDFLTNSIYLFNVKN